jgi:hypothetical protein
MDCSSNPEAEIEKHPEKAGAEEVDLMDTAQDMAEGMVDIPARDIKSLVSRLQVQ